MVDMDAYLTCGYCGETSAPVECDGSEWCRKCGYERSNFVVGNEYHSHAEKNHAESIHNQLASHHVTMSPVLRAEPPPATAPHLSVHTAQNVKHDLEMAASRCDIPEHIVHQSYALFTEIHAQRETRAQMQKALLANCVYRCCLANNIQRSCKDIKTAFGVTAKKFNITEKILQQHAPCFGTHAAREDKVSDAGAAQGCDKTDYGIAPNVYRHAIFLPDNARNIPVQTIHAMNNLYAEHPIVHGKSPDKLSACALFVMCGMKCISLCGKCSGADIKCVDCVKYACSNFDVGKITLSNHYKLLRSLLSTSVPAS